MYTSLMWLALVGVGAPADAPGWQTDYSQARREGAAKNRPLAVFLAPGKGGWEKVATGKLNGPAHQLLASRFIPVHIDTDTEKGRQMARDFEMTSGVGLVISDRSGQFQAFRHEGKLSATDLTAYLERYAASGRVVQTTDTHSAGRTSYYQGGANPANGYPAGGYTYPGAFQGWSQPSYGFAPSFSGGGSC
jgi:hypothetical protein